MKRFILFAGDDYYPQGGWGDFRGFFDTIEECLKELIKTPIKYDWAHVYDTAEKTKRKLI